MAAEPELIAEDWLRIYYRSEAERKRKFARWFRSTPLPPPAPPPATAVRLFELCMDTACLQRVLFAVCTPREEPDFRDLSVRARERSHASLCLCASAVYANTLALRECIKWRGCQVIFGKIFQLRVLYQLHPAISRGDREREATCKFCFQIMQSFLARSLPSVFKWLKAIPFDVYSMLEIDLKKANFDITKICI